VTKVLAEFVKSVTRTSDYLRGDGAASDYQGFADPQGRTFRKWADTNHLAFSVIENVRTYRKSDIDRLWIKTAHNLPLNQRTAV
jgi:hypothetical protein